MMLEEQRSRAGGWSEPRILLAEDDDEMRRLLTERLRKQGYEVIENNDGLSLLDCITELRKQVRNGRFFDVDLIISDIRMPLVTGVEVLRELRVIDRKTPVILITAFGDEVTRARAFREGASLVFDKPFDMDELLGAVREVVGA